MKKNTKSESECISAFTSEFYNGFWIRSTGLLTSHISLNYRIQFFYRCNCCLCSLKLIDVCAHIYLLVFLYSGPLFTHCFLFKLCTQNLLHLFFSTFSPLIILALCRDHFCISWMLIWSDYKLFFYAHFFLRSNLDRCASDGWSAARGRTTWFYVWGCF